LTNADIPWSKQEGRQKGQFQGHSTQRAGSNDLFQDHL
jgi:hypothetical protein